MIPGRTYDRTMRAAIASLALLIPLVVTFAVANDCHLGKDPSCLLCHLRLCCPITATDVPQLPQPDYVLLSRDGRLVSSGTGGAELLRAVESQFPR